MTPTAVPLERMYSRRGLRVYAYPRRSEYYFLPGSDHRLIEWVVATGADAIQTILRSPFVEQRTSEQISRNNSKSLFLKNFSLALISDST